MRNLNKDRLINITSPYAYVMKCYTVDCQSGVKAQIIREHTRSCSVLTLRNIVSPSVLLDDESLIIRFKTQFLSVLKPEGANQRKFEDTVEFV
jgi:hypothetical protein